MDIKRPEKLSFGRLILYIFSGLVFLYLIAPLLIVIPISFSSSSYLEFPPKGFSLQWYESFFTDSTWITATLLSIRVGLLTMLLATVLGTMAALGLIRGKFPGKDLVNAFFLSPLIVPTIIIALAIYSIFSYFNLIGSTLGLVVAHTLIAIPFVITTVSSSLRTFDHSLEYAARSLGASRFTAFRKVVFPLIKPGIISGGLFAFITSFDEIVITMFISGVNSTLPKKMFDDIRTEIDPTIAAISTLLILVSTLILLWSTFITSNEKKV